MNLEQKIEEIKNIKGSCGKFPIPRFTTESMIEEFHKYYHYIKECISKTNDTLDIVKWLVNQGLSEEVANRLIIMIEEGVISDSIFKNPLFIKSINDKITEFKNDGTFNDLIEQQLNSIYQLIDEKMNEITGTVNSIIDEVDMRILELQNFETQLEQIESKNTEQDVRLKDIEYKNKVQDTYISGLFNENNDKRLSIEGEGNSLKLESSKEGLVEVNKVVGNTFVNIMPDADWGYLTTGEQGGNCAYMVELSTLPFKPNTVYTTILLNAEGIIHSHWMHLLSTSTTIDGTIGSFTTVSDISTATSYLHIYFSNGVTQEQINKIKVIVLEGDYTNKPIPSEYFEGMQSSFEECKVTQEMVDSGEESVENLGKYKCNVKVKGANMYQYTKLVAIETCNEIPPTYSNSIIHLKGKQADASNKSSYNNGYVAIYGTKGFELNKYYAISIKLDVVSNPWNMTQFQCLLEGNGVNGGFLVLDKKDNRWKCIIRYINDANISTVRKGHIELRVSGCEVNISEIQIEEVETINSQATAYEPYYERTQTVYLNSPLLKGDEIVAKEDGLYHYHKMKQDVLDGSEDENWAKNPIPNQDSSVYITCSLKPNDYNSVVGICDKLPIVANSTQLTSNKSIFFGRSINITLLVSEAGSTVEEFKAWLQDNPITVVYELAEP